MIAIPNMEKPKSCNECPIRIAETVGIYYDNKSDEFKRVKITGCNESKYHTKTLGEGYKVMYKDCPLIEVDDELIKELQEMAIVIKAVFNRLKKVVNDSDGLKTELMGTNPNLTIFDEADADQRTQHVESVGK